MSSPSDRIKPERANKIAQICQVSTCHHISHRDQGRKQPVFVPLGLLATMFLSNFRQSHVPCFISAALLPVRPPGSSSSKSSRPPYRRPRVRAVDSVPKPTSDEDELAVARRNEAAANGSACFLACVECGAVYALDSEELDNEPRAVQCALCRHEWLATERDLLWGADHARVASAPRAKAAAAAAARLAVKRSASVPRVWESGVAAEGIMPALADGGGDALLVDEEDEEDDGAGEDEGLHIFVGNLSFRANEQDLLRAFAAYGRVKVAHIPTDGVGASRGYGFVQMVRRSQGKRAMEALQGVSVVGREITLSEARPRHIGEKNHNNSNRRYQDRSRRPERRYRDAGRSNYYARKGMTFERDTRANSVTDGKPSSRPR